jgi:hypothetical protein
MWARRVRQDRGLQRLRVCVATVVAAWMLGRPVPLASVRWWQSPRIATSIGLTGAQREAINRAYEYRLPRRRTCVERRVEASNRANALVQDGVYDENVLMETEAAADAAMQEHALSEILNDEIGALLSPEQRQRLAVVAPGRLAD